MREILSFSPLDLRLALGDVVVCDTCGGRGEMMTDPDDSTTAGPCPDFPDCRNGVRPNPDKVEVFLTTYLEEHPKHSNLPTVINRQAAEAALWALIDPSEPQ